MTRRMKRIASVALAILHSSLFALTSSLAQTTGTVVWQLRPTDYTAMTLYGNGLYQVAQGERTGLIRADGTIVLPLSTDQRIVGYYEGMAVVLRPEDGKQRIVGSLSSDGTFNPFEQAYYAKGTTPFYSQGLLVAQDEQGRDGYVDAKGNARFGFDGTLTKVAPFTNGYAAVAYKGRPTLITLQGRTVPLSVGTAKIVEVSNPDADGYACVYALDGTSEGKFFRYNLNAAANQAPAKRVTVKDGTYDYLRRVAAWTGAPATVPFVAAPQGETGIAPTQAGDLYGYGSLCAPQFDEATPFVDGLAVVKRQGRYGILRLVTEQRAFGISVPDKTISFTQGKAVSPSFSLAIPSAWSDNDLTVTLRDKSTGTTMTVDAQGGGDYAFSLQPREGTTTYDVSVTGDGLTLWEGEASFKFHRKVEVALVASLRINSAYHDPSYPQEERVYQVGSDDRVVVEAIITNRGEESVTTNVQMTGSSAFQPITATLTIAPGASGTVSSCFIVTSSQATGQYVHVSTSQGGQATLSGLTITPFD